MVHTVIQIWSNTVGHFTLVWLLEICPRPPFSVPSPFGVVKQNCKWFRAMGSATPFRRVTSRGPAYVPQFVGFYCFIRLRKVFSTTFSSFNIDVVWTANVRHRRRGDKRRRHEVGSLKSNGLKNLSFPYYDVLRVMGGCVDLDVPGWLTDLLMRSFFCHSWWQSNRCDQTSSEWWINRGVIDGD